MPEQYELVPTARQRGSRPPLGWVQLAPNMNPKRRTMTEGYLNQRMPRGNIGSRLWASSRIQWNSAIRNVII